jgi:DNA-binding MarR family transcriptional regulator
LTADTLSGVSRPRSAASKPSKRSAPRQQPAKASTARSKPASGESKTGRGTNDSRSSGGIAFLLAQLGQHAADRFAARIAELNLIPAQAGILRAIAHDPGRSQQALSEQLGLVPSRVVAFVDDLEGRGYLERRRNTQDRRLNALHLTPAGNALMGDLGSVAKAHEAELTAGLSNAQRAALGEMLRTLASRQGLTPGVHPGYRSLGRNPAETA